MLNDDAYILDGAFCFETADGVTHRLNAAIAEQPNDLSNYDHVNTYSCIRTMTYDEACPHIMLPAVVGNGATVYSHFGDFWMYENSGERQYFLYGGANDNGRVAGLFHMRAIIGTTSFAGPFHSARIMFR